MVAVKESPRTVSVSISPDSTALTISGREASSTVMPELNCGSTKANVPKTAMAMIRDHLNEGKRCSFFPFVSLSGFTFDSFHQPAVFNNDSNSFPILRWLD
jgi:hypothetical protein